MEREIEIKNGRGYAIIPKSGVLTFEVQGISEREDIQKKKYQNLYSRYISDNMTMKVGDFTVPLWGEGHNLYPQEVFSVTSDNKLLPEVIKNRLSFSLVKDHDCIRKSFREKEKKNEESVFRPMFRKLKNDWIIGRKWDMILSGIT
jgi:hypothetical protein